MQTVPRDPCSVRSMIITDPIKALLMLRRSIPDRYTISYESHDWHYTKKAEKTGFAPVK